jgi:hypothetical protein
MVESTLKLCAGGTTDGTVPFLGFGNKDPMREGDIFMWLTKMSSWN